MAARFGYAVDRLLFYGKAGGGWVGNNGLSVSNFTTGVTLGCTTLTNFTNCNNSAGGWLVGAGAEWAFAPHWSLKFEYDYLGLGNRTFTVPVTAPLLGRRYLHLQQSQCPNGENWGELPDQLGLQSLLNPRLTAADHKGSGARTGARIISLPGRRRCYVGPIGRSRSSHSYFVPAKPFQMPEIPGLLKKLSCRNSLCPAALQAAPAISNPRPTYALGPKPPDCAST